MLGPLLPRKCVVLFVDGGPGVHQNSILACKACFKLNALARDGWSGGLFLRATGSTADFAALVTQFLGCEAAGDDIPMRYKELRPIFITDSPAISAAAGTAGCTPVQPLHEACPMAVAEVGRRALDAKDGTAAAAVFVAIEHPERWEGGALGRKDESVVRWVDAFLSSADWEDTLLTVVVGMASPLPPAAESALAAARGRPPRIHPKGLLGDVQGFQPILRPLQSYQASEEHGKTSVASAYAGLTLQRMEGVTRCDDIDRFDPESICDRGGAGFILVESLLAELAFKIGHAPKYGA